MQFQVNHSPDKGRWRAYSGDTLLVEYRYRDPVDPCPAMSYVATPSGVPIALYRPWDHVWHVGLFFNWKYVNGRNFWESNYQRKEPAGTCWTVEFHGPGPEPAFRQRIEWLADDRAVMVEERQVGIVPHTESGYTITFTAEFRPEGGDLTLDATKVTPETPWGGYAGFSCRLGRNFRRPLITTSEGQFPANASHGRTARWCDYSGRVDGFQDAWAGVACFDHPENPGFPNPMLTYDTDIQFLQVGLLYERSYQVKRGEVLRLRYRAYVHDGRPDPGELESLWQAFAKEPARSGSSTRRAAPAARRQPNRAARGIG